MIVTASSLISPSSLPPVLCFAGIIYMLLKAKQKERKLKQGFEATPGNYHKIKGTSHIEG